MIRKKLVDALIALVAFVLLSTAGDVLVPQFANAALFEYCDKTMNTCPGSIPAPACAGCGAAAKLAGTCRYSDYSVCSRNGSLCENPVIFCSCNSDAC